MPDFAYSPMLPLGHDQTQYRHLSSEGVEVIRLGDQDFLSVRPEALTSLTFQAIRDIEHLLRPSHLAQLRGIIDDPEASPNDRYVALDLLKNAVIAADGVLPMCQDTGTAIVMGKRGQRVLTTGPDEEHIARGIYDAFGQLNLRYSQQAPLTMWEERNTGTNLPAQIDLYAATHPDNALDYKFLFMAKGGGSANKSYLFQKTPADLNHRDLMRFLDEQLRQIGTAACPPYHLAVVIGGTSAEDALKTAKYASARYLDSLPTQGDASGHAIRVPEMESEILRMTRAFDLGAQFGGKYFCHDVRVIRLPRHGASLPVAVAVSCSADRQAKAKITPDGVFLERLEQDPSQYLPVSGSAGGDDDAVNLDLNQPMASLREQLSGLAVGTRVSLTGPLTVARDLAHARVREALDRGEEMPWYFRDQCVYYAGPAKKPEGYASGSFGPTTAGRMDSYVDQFQRAGGSLVMLAKGNRSPAVAEACKRNGGFHLGSIGGPAARLAKDNITSVEVLDFPELGMEAVWRIEVRDFPAFVIIDDKGNDFFADRLRPIQIITNPSRKA
ncbi:MAG: fumarate hydratase [Candidatus Nanopelagicales bacterium]|nr:fumarate hydratase [Candidatus Nanopelagicales bacterium]MDZ4249321.1 fumarate hydratase [Candidatus Nanopelagicales bacterium]